MNIKNKSSRIWNELVNLIIFTFLRKLLLTSFSAKRNEQIAQINRPGPSCLTEHRFITISRPLATGAL